MGMRNKGNRKKAMAAGLGLIVLIAFYNGIGYVGNALADPNHSLMWWIIAGLVGGAVGIVEVYNIRGDK